MGKQIKYIGVDLSHWQGVIDFEKLSKVVDFAILKIGGSDNTDFYYLDKNFEHNYNQCRKYGIKTGAYWFAGSLSQGKEAGKLEARYCYAAIKNKKFELPIYLDYELGYNTAKEANTDYCFGFLTHLESCGCFVGIYGSDISTFKDKLDFFRLKDRFSIWVARYKKEPQFVQTYDMWQSTSKGRRAGINGYVDIDYMYRDLPKIITSKHFNNC